MPRKSNKPHKAIPNAVIAALADSFQKSISTINNWFDNNDDRLTSDRARRVFADHDFEWKSKDVMAEATA